MMSTSSKGTSLAGLVHADEVSVTNGVIGVVRGGNVSLTNGGAVAMVAGEDTSFRNGYCQWSLAGENASLRLAGAGVVASGNDMTVERGGGGLLAAGNQLSLTTGGGVALLAGKAELRNSYLGLLVAGKTTLGEGARVLLGTKEAVVLGVTLALALRLLSLAGGGGRRRTAKATRS